MAIELAGIENENEFYSNHYLTTVLETDIVNKHRSWTPGLREANLLIYFVNLADNRGPDRRRPGPHPERISWHYIKALRSSELGSRFGAYSHPKSCSRFSSPPSAPHRFRLGTCRL